MYFNTPYLHIITCSLLSYKRTQKHYSVKYTLTNYLVIS